MCTTKNLGLRGQVTLSTRVSPCKGWASVAVAFLTGVGMGAAATMVADSTATFSMRSFCLRSCHVSLHVYDYIHGCNMYIYIYIHVYMCVYIYTYVNRHVHGHIYTYILVEKVT